MKNIGLAKKHGFKTENMGPFVAFEKHLFFTGPPHNWI